MFIMNSCFRKPLQVCIYIYICIHFRKKSRIMIVPSSKNGCFVDVIPVPITVACLCEICSNLRYMHRCVFFIHDLLLMEEILPHLECIKTTVNTAINYQPQQHVIWFKCIYVIYIRSAWTHFSRERYHEFSGGTLSRAHVSSSPLKQGFPSKTPPNKRNCSTAGMGDYKDHLKGTCFNQGNKKRSKTTTQEFCGFC